MASGRVSGGAIEREYRRRTPGSAELAKRASATLPGGNTRTTVYHAPYPLTFARGDGPWLWDLDGNRYLDLFYNGLSIIHGHGYAPIREAVQEAMLAGTALGSTSSELVEFAELLQGRLPHAEQLRFTNSGSEAGMIAARIARAATGRPLLVKARHAYHGCYPDLEAGLYGIGDMPGRTLVAEFNNLQSFERLLAEHGSEVAAIVIEPVMFTGRVVTPEPGFLDGVQRLVRRHSCLFILDDCLMFRLAEGGSAQTYGLSPDLTILGKFLGGGFPMGAVAGSTSVMSLLDPRRSDCIFHGGSFNGNRISATAGRIAVRDLTAGAIQAMDGRAATLRRRIEAKADSLGVPVAVTGTGSIAGICFLEAPARHEEHPSEVDLATLFLLACLNQGVSLQPGGLISLATMVDDDALEFGISGIESALEQIAGL